jgi:hypothetical protein
LPSVAFAQEGLSFYFILLRTYFAFGTTKLIFLMFPSK